MRPDAASLRAFYDSGDGRRTARRLAQIVAPLVVKDSERRFLALGYAGPLLTGLDPSRFERMALLLPRGQGAEPWPCADGNCAAVGDEHDLPFSGALFDQALVVHALEHGEPAAMLADLHRVLAPAGDLILIVPNRAGLWTHFEWTPFGAGRPFGRGELTRLLAACDFVPRFWKTALVAPPLGGLRRLDRPLTAALPRLGGIHVVLARKTGGPGPAAVRRAARARRPAAVPAAPAAARLRP